MRPIQRGLWALDLSIELFGGFRGTGSSGYLATPEKALFDLRSIP